MILLSWLAMMVVHELGHVVAAWATGGKVTRVVLHPLAISRTDVSPNPRPLTVVWAGPLLGCLLPTVGLVGCRVLRFRSAYLIQFFAATCLVANGVYIGIGSFQGIGDAGDMLRLGSQEWQLWTFGSAAFVLGLGLYHGLGPKFGLGDANGQVSHAATYWVASLLLVVVVLELLLSPRS